jgi:hypothetical protein
VSHGQRNGSPWPYSRIRRQHHLLPLIITMLPNNNLACALFTLFTTAASISLFTWCLESLPRPLTAIGSGSGLSDRPGQCFTLNFWSYWFTSYRSPCGDGLEYLHRIPASRKRLQKGTKCPGYNWVTLFLGDINTGTWPSRLRESQMRE